MEKNNSLVPQKQFKGVVPIVKSFLFGTESGLIGGPDGIQNSYTTQSFFQWISGTVQFNREGLKYLVETGYANNPIVNGVITKILNAQSSIIFTPYRNGKPYKSGKFNLDMNFATLMLLATGTCIIYKQKIVGFPEELKVLNTLQIIETTRRGAFKYQLDMLDGTIITLTYEDIIFVKFDDISSKIKTNLGLCPLQVALMAIESLKYMYLADASTLKNKGVDGILTNDSGEALAGEDSESMQIKLNKQLNGARKSGTVAASTAPLRYVQTGRSSKEMLLWDGAKIKGRDICTVFQVNAGQLNDPESSKYANANEYNKALYNDCVIPFTRKITENKELVAYLGYEIYLDTSQIDCLQQAQKERAEKAQSRQSAIIELNTKVGDGTLLYDSAIKILVSEWEFDEEEAKGYIKIPNQPIPPTATE